MGKEVIHRFEQDGRRFAIDPETCFCFECDAVSWDVLAYYPDASVTRILHELGGRHDPKELKEVVSELEWLRATKSILPHTPPDKFIKQFEIQRGLRCLTVRLPRHEPVAAPARRGWFGRPAVVLSQTARDMGIRAIELLLARSDVQKDLSIAFLEEDCAGRADLLADLCVRALQSAAVAGKKLTAAVEISGVEVGDPPEALQGHGVRVQLEFRQATDVSAILKSFVKSGFETLPRLAKALDREGCTGRIIVQPNHPAYGQVVRVLHDAGFRFIELDLDGAHVSNPALEPGSMLEGLRESAVYYARELQANRYFRLEPIASLFHRIHEGQPLRRADAAGVHELAVNEDGSLYPSRRMVGRKEFRAGSLTEGTVDEALLRRFDDVGSMTTAACRRCWARNLCGGGCAAVHHAFTGSYRRPHEPWCDAQRAWMASAVAAFNLLTSAGVNFSRIYGAVAGAAKPSLWTMVRAAMQMTVSMRPIEEGDAPMLAKWENWSDASYFVCHPGGVLLATVYEREMDALHPQTLEQEMVLTRRTGEPIGLFRMGPDKTAGVALAAVFLRDPADYGSQEIRKGCRLLLDEAGKQQALRRILVHAGDHEPHLQEFLAALGFERAGTLREGLFLHGRRHDVGVYVLSMH